MKEGGSVALVPKPSSALQKVEDGFGRILSGMVADTLALLRREATAKQVMRVLTCTGDEDWSELWRETIQTYMGSEHVVEVTDQHHAKEIVELFDQRPFDLVVAVVNNILPSAKWNDTDSRVRQAVEFLISVKDRFGVPVIAFSTYEPESFDMETLLTLGGIDAVITSFWKARASNKFSSEFRSALDVCLGPAQTDWPKGPRRPRIVMLDDDRNVRGTLKFVLEFTYENAEILAFGDVDDALCELERQPPDVFLTDYNHPKMTGAELATMLVQRGVEYPIFLISAGADLIEEAIASGVYWPPSANVTVLSKPFKIRELRQLLEPYIGLGRELSKAQPPSGSHPSALSTSSPMVLNVVLVNDEPVVLGTFEYLLRHWFDGAKINKYVNGDDAWKAVSERDPDLLITDDVMPGMSGKELCQRLLEKQVRYPIIVNSPLQWTEDWVRELSEHGLNVHFVLLPATIQSIRNALNDAGVQIPEK